MCIYLEIFNSKKANSKKYNIFVVKWRKHYDKEWKIRLRWFNAKQNRI